MLKENISLTQLFALIVNYLIGTATITGIGKEAMQDSWIAVLIATVIGIGLMYFYYSFNKLLPNKNLYEIMEYCFTRPAAILFSLGYITYFLYILTLVIRAFTEVMHSAILIKTPQAVIIITMILLFNYIVYLGLEIIARVTEIFIPYVLGFIFILFLLLLSSGVFDLHNLQPVLGEGFKPILKSLYPSLISYPFGELVVFTVVLSSVSKLKESKKVSIMAVAVAGLLLAFGSLVIMATLGIEYIQFSSFPIYSAARRVAIGDFIERIDALAVFIIMLGVLIKGTIYFYVGLKGLEYVFRIPYRYFTIPISMNVTIFTILTSMNVGEFSFELIKSTFPYIHPVMQLAIPAFIMAMLLWKTKKRNPSKNAGKQAEEMQN